MGSQNIECWGQTSCNDHHAWPLSNMPHGLPCRISSFFWIWASMWPIQGARPQHFQLLGIPNLRPYRWTCHVMSLRHCLLMTVGCVDELVPVNALCVVCCVVCWLDHEWSVHTTMLSIQEILGIPRFLISSTTHWTNQFWHDSHVTDGQISRISHPPIPRWWAPALPYFGTQHTRCDAEKADFVRWSD